MLAGGICGSDIPKFLGSKAPADPPPGFPLHEIVGKVVASADPSLSAGAQVVGWSPDSTGLAEYVLTWADQVAEYPESLPPAEAVLIQPLACVLHALDEVPFAGARVAVLGLGPMGLLFGHVLRTGGAGHVVGVDPVDRRSCAARFGFDDVLVTSSGEWSREDARPNLVVEAVGRQTATLQHAIDGVAVGGCILYFGIPDEPTYPLDMERLVRKNLTLTAGVARRRREMLTRAGAYLLDHPALARDLISDEFPMTQAQQAFELVARRGERRKVVLAFP